MPQFDQATPVVRDRADGRPMRARFYNASLADDPEAIAHGNWGVSIHDTIREYNATAAALEQSGKYLIRMGGVVYEDGFMSRCYVSADESMVRFNPDAVSIWAYAVLEDTVFAAAFPEEYSLKCSKELRDQERAMGGHSWVDTVPLTIEQWHRLFIRAKNDLPDVFRAQGWTEIPILIASDLDSLCESIRDTYRPGEAAPLPLSPGAAMKAAQTGLIC